MRRSLLSGFICGTVAIAIAALLPEEAYNFATVSGLEAIFVVPVSIVFMIVCIVSGTDYISNSNVPGHHDTLFMLLLLSAFIAFFFIGAFVGWLLALVRRDRSNP